ncbi:MAG TPA: alpha/beta hydrolase, partial [Chloroflexota bacterium]
IDGVAKLAARGIPLLVVHGEADNYIPVVHGRRIATAYGTNVQTLFVPDAGHVRSYEVAPIVYIDRLLAFFKQSE